MSHTSFGHEDSECSVRSFDEQGCRVMAVVTDPDTQRIVYGTVTLDGRLLGSFYPRDVSSQSGWRVVVPDGRQIEVDSEGHAIMLLVLTEKGLDAYDKS